MANEGTCRICGDDGSRCGPLDENQVCDGDYQEYHQQCYDKFKKIETLVQEYGEASSADIQLLVQAISFVLD